MVKEIIIESLIIGALSFNYIMTTSTFDNNLNTKVNYGYIGTGLVLGIVGVTFILNLVYVWKSLKDLETKLPEEEKSLNKLKDIDLFKVKTKKQAK